MLALVPPLGAGMQGSRAVLKWAGPGPLVIEESRLSPVSGDPHSALDDALGLARGMRIDAPTSLSLAELHRLPHPLRWQVNGLSVENCPFDPGQALQAVWLPLVLPIEDDPHFLIAMANSGPDPVRLPELVYESTLTVDARPFAFVDPGHWDGKAVLHPGAGTMLRFRFGDFGTSVPVAPATMAFTAGDWTTRPTRVAWRRADQLG